MMTLEYERKHRGGDDWLLWLWMANPMKHYYRVYCLAISITLLIASEVTHAASYTYHKVNPYTFTVTSSGMNNHDDIFINDRVYKEKVRAVYDRASIYDINDTGIIVGRTLCPNGNFQSFQLVNGEIQCLPQLGDLVSRGRAINANGIIVGDYDIAAGEKQAFHYDGTYIDGIIGGDQSSAMSVNDDTNPWIVGYRNQGGKDTAVRLRFGEGTYPIELIPVPDHSYATALTNSMHDVDGLDIGPTITGYALFEGSEKVFVWKSGKAKFIPYPVNVTAMIANDINNSEIVVGQMVNSGGQTGFVYVNNKDLLLPLNDLVEGDLNFSDAVSINDRNEILALDDKGDIYFLAPKAVELVAEKPIEFADGTYLTYLYLEDDVFYVAADRLRLFKKTNTAWVPVAHYDVPGKVLQIDQNFLFATEQNTLKVYDRTGNNFSYNENYDLNTSVYGLAYFNGNAILFNKDAGGNNVANQYSFIGGVWSFEQELHRRTRFQGELYGFLHKDNIFSFVWSRYQTRISEVYRYLQGQWQSHPLDTYYVSDFDEQHIVANNRLNSSSIIHYDDVYEELLTIAGHSPRISHPYVVSNVGETAFHNGYRWMPQRLESIPTPATSLAVSGKNVIFIRDATIYPYRIAEIPNQFFQSDLSVQIIAQTEAPIGQYFNYKIHITNQGPDTANNVRVKHTLPLPGRYQNNHDDICYVESRTITCTIPEITSGEPFTLDIGIFPTVENVDLTLSAQLSGNYLDPNIGNDSHIITTRTKVGDPHLGVIFPQPDEFIANIGQAKIDILLDHPGIPLNEQGMKFYWRLNNEHEGKSYTSTIPLETELLTRENILYLAFYDELDQVVQEGDRLLEATIPFYFETPVIEIIRPRECIKLIRGDHTELRVAYLIDGLPDVLPSSMRIRYKFGTMPSQSTMIRKWLPIPHDLQAGKHTVSISLHDRDEEISSTNRCFYIK